METITIDRLPKAEDLTEQDLFLVNQLNDTKSVSIKKISEYIRDGNITEILYTDLITLISNDLLVCGTKYLITDFSTVYIQPESSILSTTDANLTCPTEPLLVFATSNNTLDVKAYSPIFPQDEIWYDVTQNNTACYSWAAPKDKGQIFRRITKNGNDFPYDVRNIKFRRWSVDYSQYPEWASGTNYNSNQIVYYNNAIWVSARNDNTGNAPAITGALAFWWERVTSTNDISRFIVCYFGTNPEDSDYNKWYRQILDNDYYFHVNFNDKHDFYTFDNGAKNQIDTNYIFKNKISFFIQNSKRYLNNSIFIGNSFSSNTIGNYFIFNRFGDKFQNQTITFTSAISVLTAVRYNEFKNGFVNAKIWGTSQNALLMSDHSAEWRQAVGSNTVMYLYQDSAGSVQTGAI
jgi:hypothetical protein